MTWRRRILPILLILGIALGTSVQVAQVGMMAGMHAMALSLMDDGMGGCDGCASGHETSKGMNMAGCTNGLCIVLPGLLPSLPGSPAFAPGAFAAAAPTAVSGLSPPPDHRPPRPASVA